jgi:hypothetical protein
MIKLPSFIIPVQGSFIIPVEGVLSYQCREFYHVCVGICIIPVQGVLSYLCRTPLHRYDKIFCTGMMKLPAQV